MNDKSRPCPKLIWILFAVLAGAMNVSGCQFRGDPKTVSGSGKSLEIPPDLRRQSKTEQATATSQKPLTGASASTLDISKVDTSSANIAPLDPVPALGAFPVNPAQPTPTPAFLNAAPKNPAMTDSRLEHSKSENEQDNTVYRLRGRQADEEDEVDTYALPIDVPAAFDGLGGGDTITNTGIPPTPPHSATPHLQTPNLQPSLNTKTLRETSRDGTRAINLAIDGFEYVRALRSAFEAAQGDVDAALGTLMQLSIQKNKGKLDDSQYLGRRTTGLVNLEAALNQLDMSANQIDLNLARSPLHGSPLAQNVRAAAAAERKAWREGVNTQAVLFDRHANGTPRSDLKIPSINLFFPYLTAKAEHLSAAYELEASTITPISRHGIVSVPGGAQAFLLAMVGYNRAHRELLDATRLVPCGAGRYKAYAPENIIPALNKIDQALSFVPGLDRDVLAVFTPVLIEAGVTESAFVRLRGPISNALNELEVTTMSRLATGYKPIFDIVETNTNLDVCEGANGTPVKLADAVSQIGSISLEEIIDPLRKDVFEASRDFYLGMSAPPIATNIEADTTPVPSNASFKTF